MSSAVGRYSLARRLRAIGVLAGLTIGSAVLVAPQAGAQAPMDGATVRSGGLPYDKLPAGAVPATGELPAPGSYGPAFQPPPSTFAVAPYVVGGVPASASDYPWIVGIKTRFLGQDVNGNIGWYVSTCSGTVIGSTKVLTAGHCVTDLPFGTTVVIAGRNNLATGDGGYVVGVSSTWTHQNFNLAALNSGTARIPLDDVAVLTVKHPLPNAYRPVALTGQGNQTPYAANTSALVVGYGITRSGTSNSGTLYKATVSIQSDSTCRTAMPGYDATRMTCAGLPQGGVDSCHGDSGGPLVVNGVEAAIVDWGSDPCGAAGTYGVYERLSTYSNLIKQNLTRPPLVNLDWSGDGHSDLLARDADGNLLEYSGAGFLDNGYHGFSASGTIGEGWTGYSKLFRVTNWNGDDTESIMAMAPSGNLYQYTSDGGGGFTTGIRIQVGVGWSMFTDVMVVNNWTGNGRPNLIGRTPGGDLYLYTSNGAGGWLNGGIGIKIGNGWNMFDTVLTPGTWKGDGHQALIGRTPAGDLFLYRSNGSSGWMNNGVGQKIGNGWNAFTIFMSPGDWNGDDMVDLIGITPSGLMNLYLTDGVGNWLNGGVGRQIGTGWNAVTAVF